jgi:hypothetical protein
VRVSVGVAVAVGVAIGVGVSVSVAVGVGVSVGVAVAVGVIVSVGVAVGVESSVSSSGTSSWGESPLGMSPTFPGSVTPFSNNDPDRRASNRSEREALSSSTVAGRWLSVSDSLSSGVCSSTNGVERLKGDASPVLEADGTAATAPAPTVLSRKSVASAIATSDFVFRSMHVTCPIPNP